MSIPQKTSPAKLVIGIFTSRKDFFTPLASKLSGLYGRADTVSAWMEFDYTDYYEKEMGAPLYRRMMSFEPLMDQDDLADIKLATNALEQGCAGPGGRQVNIDPGYMALSRFVLATGKDFAHRISVGKGIYGDLTLLYKNGAFATLPWTYPDYADKTMLSYLSSVRNKYVYDLKSLR